MFVVHRKGIKLDRVHALHARKMTALLQASTASDPEKEPILLLVDRESGHGYGAPVDKQLLSLIDHLSFFRWQLGMGQACAGGERRTGGGQASTRGGFNEGLLFPATGRAPRGR